MKKKSRKDCYFGLHYDFHAVALTKGIGTLTDAEAFGRLLDRTKPDFVQIDTKGHPGLSSYFTKYGSRAPGLEVDFLKVIREETAKRGILLYGHHSGNYDMQAVKEHPEWAVWMPDGTLSPGGIINPLGGYTEERLIPQLKELALDYGLDGVWMDGECWGAWEDFNPEVLNEFYRKSGYSRVEKELTSPSRVAFREFCRERFCRYVRHYATEVKKVAPHFEIASNFAFSHMMPVEPFPEVDYLSGDICASWYTRTTTRCFAGLGKPWDLMSWGGIPNSLPGHGMGHLKGVLSVGIKSSRWLMRDAATAISLGGGFQMCNPMSSQGKIYAEDTQRLGEISDFMAERREFNFGSTPLKNAAVLLTHRGLDGRSSWESLYHAVDGDMEQQLCDLVLDGGRPVDIIYDFEVENNSFREHSAVILPDYAVITEEMRNNLCEYVREGGSLIACGRTHCEEFAPLISARVLPDTEQDVVVRVGDGFFAFNGSMALFEKNNAEDLCDSRLGWMESCAPKCSAAVTEACGDGRVTLIGWDILFDYGRSRSFCERDCMRAILDRVDPNPTAYLKSGPRRVDIIPAVKEDKLLVNLVNSSEIYYEKQGYDDFPALTDLEVAVRYPVEVNKITLEPEHRELSYTREGEYLIVKVQRLDIHSVLVIE